MPNPQFRCRFCGRTTFKSQSALTQHQRKAKVCFTKLKAELGSHSNYTTASEFLPFSHVGLPLKRSYADFLQDDFSPMTDKLGANGEKTDGMDHSGGGSFELNNEQNDYESEQEYLDVLANGSESDREDGPPAPQNNATLLQFHEYLDKAQYFTPLTGKIRTAIKLLKNLRRTKASLGTYDMMMRWHLEANGVIDEQDSLKLCPDFISKEKLYKYLARRYNRDEGYGNIEEIVLPSTKQKARIVWNDAAKVIQSLLVDPRIRDEDYLFFNNDPFCPPPAPS